MTDKPLAPEILERQRRFFHDRALILGDHGVRAGADPEQVFVGLAAGAGNALADVLRSPKAAADRLREIADNIEKLPTPPPVN